MRTISSLMANTLASIASCIRKNFNMIKKVRPRSVKCYVFGKDPSEKFSFRDRGDIYNAIWMKQRR